MSIPMVVDAMKKFLNPIDEPLEAAEERLMRFAASNGGARVFMEIAAQPSVPMQAKQVALSMLRNVIVT